MTDKDEVSCLFIACRQEHLEVAKVLIKAGGETLLLKTRKDDFTCLHVACSKGHLEIVTALVEAGGEALLLKTDSTYGFSCLHSACFVGHAPVVTYLLSLSCAGLVGLRDCSGLTALDLAVAEGHADVAEAMRASGRGTA